MTGASSTPFRSTLGRHVKIIYENFSIDDLQGSTMADFFVNIEADVAMIDEGKVIYSELAFPVAELARALRDWVESGELRGDEFSFDSLSFGEPGSVFVKARSGSWLWGSGFSPGESSALQSWNQIIDTISEFTDSVRRDIRSVGIDADYILGPPAEMA